MLLLTRRGFLFFSLLFGLIFFGRFICICLLLCLICFFIRLFFRLGRCIYLSGYFAYLDGITLVG